MGWIYATTHLYGRFEKKLYIPKFTSTGGLRGNKVYLPEIVNGIVCLYVTMVCLLRITEKAKKKIVLAYKGCSHYCVGIQVCHWLCTYGTTKVKQETYLARNDFDHDNDNIISSLKKILKSDILDW